MSEPVAPATIVILIVTVFASLVGFRNPAFLDQFLFEPRAILRGRQYYRMLTSAFLHGDLLHLVFNAYSLYSFGSAIEDAFGVPTLVVIYFGSILGGSLLSLWLHRHHAYRALGASGGVCGVIFASIFLLPGSGVLIFPIPFAIPAWLYAIAFIVLSFIGLRRQTDNIGHDAHLGGAIIGLLIATLLHPNILPQNPILYPGVMALAVILFLYVWLNPLFLPLPSLLGEWRRKRRENTTQLPSANAEAELDLLLDQIRKRGLEGLSQAERDRLNSLSRSR